MQVFVLFLVLAFAAGVAPIGRVVRRHPILLLFAAVLFASSFYSLRVVL